MALFFTVYQGLTRISSGSLEDSKGNIHSGALPPWLDGLGACNELEKSIGPGDGAQKNSKTTSKSNPKRVGAAWAEKRKLELEMEKRGEIVVNSSDANWLPNFGRVWHSGSRKESMKEFKKEKLNVSIAESKTEFEIKLHPYISKKMVNALLSSLLQWLPTFSVFFYLVPLLGGLIELIL